MNGLPTIIGFLMLSFNLLAQVNEGDTAKEIIIRFDNLSLQIDDIDVWDENGTLKRTHKDTVKIDLDIGELLTGNKISVLNSDYDQIRIFQKFENSVTIMNEGPHCDLVDWKHYYSDWIELKQPYKYVFEAITLTAEHTEKFIPVNLDEFKNAVSLHCGNSWTELIKNINSVNEYPCGIGTSRIFLKLVLRNSKTNILEEKIIEFEVPMGC